MELKINNDVMYGVENVVKLEEKPLSKAITAGFKWLVISFALITIISFIVFCIGGFHLLSTISTLILTLIISSIVLSCIYAYNRYTVMTNTDLINTIKGMSDDKKSINVLVKDNEIALPYQLFIPAYDLNTDIELLDNDCQYDLKFADLKDWQIKPIQFNSIKYEDQIILSRIKDIKDEDVIKTVKHAAKLNQQIIEAIKANYVTNTDIKHVNNESVVLNDFIKNLKKQI